MSASANVPPTPWRQTILFAVNARRPLNDLSNEIAAKITIVYFVDVRGVLLNAPGDKAHLCGVSPNDFILETRI